MRFPVRAVGCAIEGPVSLDAAAFAASPTGCVVLGMKVLGGSVLPRSGAIASDGGHACGEIGGAMGRVPIDFHHRQAIRGAVLGFPLHMTADDNRFAAYR